MNRIFCLVAVVAIIGGAQGADLTWTGAESAVWDAQAVNWQDANGTACAWADGSTAVFPAGGTVTNITVSGEVKPNQLICSPVDSGPSAVAPRCASPVDR